MKCEQCGKMGHAKDTCWKIKGFPDWFYEKRGEKPHQKTRYPHNAHAASTSNPAAATQDENMMNLGGMLNLQEQTMQSGQSQL